MKPADNADSIAQEFHLNPDFDFSLTGAESRLDSPGESYVHEMTWHFLFAPSPRDSLIVFKPFPMEFMEYLRAKNLETPRIVLHPDFTPTSRFAPFGWNAQTKKLAARYDSHGSQVRHPDLDTIRKVNSREFSLGLEGTWSGSRLFREWNELEFFLQKLDVDFEWMAKGIHGHAGTANLHFRTKNRSEMENQFLKALLRDHDALVLEPWHQRIMDLAVNFTVSEGGEISDFRGHELLNSRDGAFLGIKIFPDRMPPNPWRVELMASARKLGQALWREGYFGPVSVDAYVHSTPTGPQLRALVDVNARLSMAAQAHGLAKRIPDRHLIWTWIKPRKLRPLSDYADMETKLGVAAFDPITQRGILPVSPIRATPRRIGFLLAGRDEDDLRNLQNVFRNKLGRV